MNKDRSTEIFIAHDSFTQHGGAERIFSGFVKMFPSAKSFTLVSQPKIEKSFHDQQASTSRLQKFYNWIPNFQWLFVFIPLVLKTTPQVTTKVLLSSSSAYLKALPKSWGTVHINYCHTPTRFLWSDYDYALHEIPAILRPLAKAYFAWLKYWDIKASKNVDLFIANSKEVQKRIKKYYNRNSQIIYPFIDTEFWKPTVIKQDYFLIAGRLAPYKNHDQIIKIFNQLGKPLHVVGAGRYQEYLKSIAGPNIKFLGLVSDQELRDQYSGALGFIYPQVEDFGMMPLEAAACGTATIGQAKGGSLETIIPGQTGELLDQISAEKLSELINRWDQSKYQAKVMRTHAEQFSRDQFEKKLNWVISKFLS